MLSCPRRQAMRIVYAAVLFFAFAAMTSCKQSPDSIVSEASGKPIAGMTARAVGGDSPFGGEVNQTSDLDDLVAAAWGTERLGLHRGHAPIQNVLEAFLGITHSQMHIFMEEEKMNLADVCRRLGFAPENLVESLAASFAPFVEEGVRNGVIAADEAAAWNEKIRDTFHRRVHWRE